MARKFRLVSAAVTVALSTGSSPAPAHAVNADTGCPDTGTNPSRAVIASTLDGVAKAKGVPRQVLKVIAYKESTWRQFDSTGHTVYTSDGGIGMMQLTGDTAKQFNVCRLFTDVKYNIESGANVLLQKMNKAAEGVPATIDRSLIENWYLGIRYYNGGGPEANRYVLDAVNKLEMPPSLIAPYTAAQAVTTPREVWSSYGEPVRIRASRDGSWTFYSSSLSGAVVARGSGPVHTWTASAGDADGDADGVVDGEDTCPSVAGVVARRGCPLPDRSLSSDMNGDGKADVFYAGGDGKWRVSYAGSSAWSVINSSVAPADRLLLGDFNGDRKADVFYAAADGTWRVSYSGTGAWTVINNSPAWAQRLSLGDFNGDGKADVFYAAADGTWRVSYSGTGAWTVVNSTTAPFERLMVGVFNGDRKADVFYAAADGTWRVSYSGTGAWTVINKSVAPVEQLQLGDFNADGKADVFLVGGDGSWRVSYSGTGAWSVINNSTAPVERLQLGDLNGDRKADVFYKAADGTWRVSSGGTSAWTTINNSTAPLTQLFLR